MKTPKLEPPKPVVAVPVSAPMKSPAATKSDYRPALPLNYNSDLGYLHGSHTVNPLNLSLPPDWQFGNPFLGLGQHNSMLHPMSKNIHLGGFSSHPFAEKAQHLDITDYDFYQLEQARVKVEGWNAQALNPLAAYQSLNGNANNLCVPRVSQALLREC